MNWMAVLPEIVLVTMACVVTLADLWVSDPRRSPTYWLTQLSLAAVAGLHLWAFDAGDTVYAMQDMVVADPMGHLLAVFTTLCVMATLAYSRGYAMERDMLKGELFTLSMFSLLGANVMVSANNFLVVYVGLELMTLSLYALTALRRDNLNATEAAMKFFVLGALASGFLLYGLSMMYGATGSLTIPQVFEAIQSGALNESVLVFGVVFVVAGLAFKLGAVPFHMWLPDVYQGAPTAVTLFIGSVTEFAAFAFVLRLLIQGLGVLAIDWQGMLVVMAVLSIVVGNITAIAQTNIKRMLGYSAISHMGYMLYGFMSASVNGFASSMFYITAYVIMTLAAFGIILLLSRKGFEAENLDDFRGLNQRSPWYAFLMLITMFSMAGLPPTLGFYAKFTVLQAALQAGFVWLVVFAVLMAVVGAFYYLRVVKLMYFDEPQDDTPIVASVDVKVLLSINAVGLLLLGLMPQHLMDICAYAISHSLQ